MKAYRTDFERFSKWYVASLPGYEADGARSISRNCDWGYTTDASKALELSPYWIRRFVCDTDRVGHKAYTTD